MSYQNRDRRLSSFLLLSFFDHFLASQFFNSHRRFHSKPRFQSSCPNLLLNACFFTKQNRQGADDSADETQ